MSAIINIGYENFILKEHTISVLAPDTASIKNRISNARQADKLVDCTRSKKTKSAILAKDGYLFLSVLTPKTIATRIEKKEKENSG